MSTAIPLQTPQGMYAPVANQAAMLALAVRRGARVLRTDTDTIWTYNGADVRTGNSSLADWKNTGTGGVSFLAPITLTATDFSAGNLAALAASHGNRTVYYNDTVDVTMTLGTDAGNGWASDNYLDVQAVGSGNVSILAGGATVAVSQGASIDTATAVSRRITLQHSAAAANNWVATSPKAFFQYTACSYADGPTVTGTTAETNLLSVPIPAGALLGGRQLELNALINFFVGAANDLRVQLGGVDLLAVGPNTGNSTTFNNGYGGTTLTSHLKFLAYGKASNAQLAPYYEPLANNSLWPVSGRGVGKTSAVDMTQPQNLVLRWKPDANGSSAVVKLWDLVIR